MVSKRIHPFRFLQDTNRVRNLSTIIHRFKFSNAHLNGGRGDEDEGHRGREGLEVRQNDPQVRLIILQRHCHIITMIISNNK
jgi:hypothetical protein